MRRVFARVSTRPSALSLATALSGFAALVACAPAAQAQIDPFRQVSGRETTGIWQRGADGAPVLVGEVYDEGVPGGARHWVYFEDYASDQPITLQASGAAYPGLAAFLNTTRRAGTRYVAMSNTSGRCAAAPVCVSLPAVADALLKAGEPEKNYGASQSLSVTNAAAGARHALLRFDADRLPPGARVVSASLSLTRLLGAGAPRVHGVAAPWDEETVTFGRFARAGADLGAGPSGPYFTEVEATVPAAGAAATAETSLRSLVQGWVDGTRPNHGLFLSRDEGEDSVVFASRESPDARVRPRLEVCSVSCEQTCANPCGRDEICAGGECVRPDDAATCYGEAPPAEDCSGNGVLAYGRCFCNPGFSGDRCQDTAVPPAEDCSGNGVLAYGRCFCNPGFSGDRCQDTALPPDAACPNDCSGAGVCMQGRCFCLPGFGGDACAPL